MHNKKYKRNFKWKDQLEFLNSLGILGTFRRDCGTKKVSIDVSYN